ncbi:MAG: hypothetical protein AUK47_05395 [Deltaproteobacteria bacterium CG2_30_63_29]|nr:MAG: hypothetical protein AUK47_05395 [Deltaproteobacteria bacterium CG2_30_63_29]PIV98545.1 MAG: hypothetical protein COW42_14090 [Deltaproteobacteria bacterium CG17_big_fil_post_rev_8_21_14_2_50_63_7]PJB40171.1 MAG: hypothetical protein CO108_15605 [Deltaproteobacteria bacterium CG_4_9_14_3_um_filter_63_12]
MFLECCAKPLLVLHGLVAIVLVGSTTHSGWLAVQALRGREAPLRRMALYCRVGGVAYLITFTFGMLIYPVFRVAVRAALLDSQFPLATAFFETKEHWSAIGLALMTYQFLTTRSLADSAPEDRRFFLWSVVCLMVVVWASLLIGLSLTALEPV